MYFSGNGATWNIASALTTSAKVAFADGALGRLKITRSATTGNLYVYTSTDGVSWSQLGTMLATAAGDIFVAASTFIGRWDGGWLGYGHYHTCLIKFAGATVVNFDAARYTGSGSTFADSAGVTWTRNGNAQFSATNLTTIMGLTNAAFTLAKSGGGVVACRDLSIRNATASPVSTFYAGARSYDGGNNTNWTFNNAPATAALVATDADSTATAAASVSIAAAADQHDQADNAIAAGAVTIAAALAATDSQELLSVGTVQIGAALAAFDGNEQLMAAAAVQIGADLALTDDAANLAASGYVWRLINDARYLKPVTSNRNIGPVKGIQL
jgi:hypothetical protein